MGTGGAIDGLPQENTVGDAATGAFATSAAFMGAAASSPAGGVLLRDAFVEADQDLVQTVRFELRALLLL